MALLQLIPDGYDYAKAQTAQSVDLIPNYKLPSDHILYITTMRVGWTYPIMRAKGYTHFSTDNESYEVGSGGYATTYPGERFEDTQRINDQFHMTSSTTEAQARANARSLGVGARLKIFETQEQVNFLEPDSVQWKWFYDELVNLHQAQFAIDGKPYVIVHNYFHFSNGIFGLGQQDRETHRKLFTTPYSQWNTITYTHALNGLPATPSDEHSVGHGLERVPAIATAFYMGVPDGVPKQLIQSFFDIQLTGLRGKIGGGYITGSHEWKPNFDEIVKFAEGDLTRPNKMKVSPLVLMTAAYFIVEFGKFLVEWSRGERQYQPIDKKPFTYYADGQGNSVISSRDDKFYVPNFPGTLQAFPFYGPDGGTGLGSNGNVADFLNFGVKAWQDTMGQCYTGTKGFLRFRLDGGVWINPSASESDLIDVFYDQRAFVRYRMQDNKLAIAFLNVFATDNDYHTLEFQHPTNSSIIYSRQVSGTGVHTELILLSDVPSTTTTVPVVSTISDFSIYFSS